MDLRRALLPVCLLACSPAAVPLEPVRAREPPPAVTTIRDEPYWQEIDHPLLDADPRRAPLVAVLLEVPGYPSPLAVGPDGLFDAGGAAHRAVPPTEPTIAAVRDGDSLVLASASGIVVLGPVPSATSAPGTVSALLPGRGRSYLRSDRGLFVLSAGRISDGPLDASAAIDLEEGTVWASATRVFGEGWSTPIPEARSIAEVVAIVSDVTIGEQHLDLVLVGAQGVLGAARTPTGVSWLDVPLFGVDRVPFDALRTAARTPDGGLLIAGAHGVARTLDRGMGPEWRTYPADRWLPSPDVRGVAIDAGWPEAGAIWVATAGGLAQITAERMTLEQKLAPFVTRIVERHDRDGAVADSHLTVRGDLSTNIPWDSDNDGSWTGYWLRSECYRYKVTQDPAAKAHFDRALEALLALHDRTGTDWFLARALIRKAGCKLDDCDAPDDGQWYTSPDGEWWVKADTSNDEVIAHIGFMGVAYDLCADDAQKERIRKHMTAIIGGIMDHGWQLVDLDGLVTRYGQFDPAYVNESIPGAVGDGGMRAAEMLAGLTLAYYLSGEERFLEGKRELIEKHAYADNAEREVDYPARRTSMDNDEMDVWSWMTLLRYETDPALYERWQRGWAHLYGKLSVQEAAQWDLVQLYNAGPAPDLNKTRRWLQLAPVDMVRWSIDNSARKDLVPVSSIYYRNEAVQRSDGHPIPYDERPTDRWNTDQYMLKGGMNGMLEMDGADVLEPYWMARHYGWITP